MIWTDELVTEFVEKYFSPKSDTFELLANFKQSRAILPSNCVIITFNLNGCSYIARDCKMPVVIAQDLHNPTFKITACEANGFIFNVGEIVFNAANYKKYGGKWNNYAVKIESLDFRIKKDDNGKIISSLIVINHFYDISNFIKR